MSSPLVPAPANIVMCFYESEWFNKYNRSKPKLYLRYIDDVLATFGKEPNSWNLLNFWNEKRPNIKLTIEKQGNHSIAFLDVFISGIDNQNLTLQTYHKLAWTGFLFINFKSFPSFSYKISLIKCLIDRSLKMFNNWNSFHSNMENAYPLFLIDKTITKCLDHKFSSN